MRGRSIWAIVAGVLTTVLLTTLVDVALHAAKVFPAVGQPMTDALAALAIPQCWAGGRLYLMTSAKG